MDGRVIPTEPAYGGAPIAVSPFQRGRRRVVQQDTVPIGRAEGGSVTQLTKVFKRWERRLRPLQVRVASAESYCNHALPRGACQREVEDVLL